MILYIIILQFTDKLNNLTIIQNHENFQTKKILIKSCWRHYNMILLIIYGDQELI